MNKVTKYISTGVATLLMLMSMGVAQNNVDASKRYYRVQTTRYTKNNYRRNRSYRRHDQKDNQRKITSKQFNQSGVTKRSRKTIRRASRKMRARKALKHNQRRIRKHVNQLRHRRYNSKKVLRSRYRLTNGNRSGNRALRKSGFVDGRILTKMGYSQDYSHYIFNKYAPNDKRAVIPNYMNPKAYKLMHKSSNYNDVNKDLWVKGIFSLTDPQNDTKNPQVYKYYQRLHGWKLAPRY